jgi:mono/diheme cytochrome c family protein
MPRPRLSATLLLLLALVPAARGAARVDYDRDVRPLLSENCFYCHGQDANKRKAKLQLNTREGQRAKEVVVPGRPDRSELVQRIFSADPEEQMPPPDSHRTLTTAQKEQLKRWVAQGAEFTGHWAFETLHRPPVPKTPWFRLFGPKFPIRNPIDAFVRAKLKQAGLSPSPEASRETLIRRVTLDLTGLPPTPEGVDAFLADKKPDAYERVVDRLLASEHYGERMALPWLDAARYADSNGFQQDGDTFQWIWRDWVVKAINDNKPFDEFTIEQLAGDLLPDPTREQLIATAFNRNHMLNGEGGAIAEEQRHVILFDRVDTTATTWMGLTVACAQCHDHKYDPIRQRDYYALMAAFNNVPENGVTPIIPYKVRVAEPLLDVASPEERAKLADLKTRVAEMKSRREIFTNSLAEMQRDWEEKVAKDESFPDSAIREFARLPPNEKPGRRESKLKAYFNEHVVPTLEASPAADLAKLERELDNFKNDDYPRVMVMAETKPRETFILERGNYEAPKEKVEFATPAFLPPMPTNAPRNRLGLARWLVSAEQPLTARVIANRQWQIFFGLGLVKTSEDFGVQGEPPAQRELLDWLAAELREPSVALGAETGRRWDMKHLHRLIVTSSTYRQTSSVSPDLLERDPENRLFARGARFRLPSMLIRDQALAASGLLVDKIGGKPVYPYQPEGIWDSLAITKERDFTYPQSTGEDLYRRSLYTFWRRTVAPADIFDASTRNVCKVRTSITSTPLQALTVLNDPAYVEAARVLAEHALQHAGPDADRRLDFAFRRVLARHPDKAETKLLRASLEKQLRKFRAKPTAAEAFLTTGASPRDPKLNATEHAAYAAVCLGILNLDETVTKP